MTEKSRRPAGSARTPSPPAPQRGLCLPRPWAPRPPPGRGSSQTQLCTHSDRPQPQACTAEPHRGGRGSSRAAESEDSGREAPRAAPTGSPLLSSDDRCSPGMPRVLLESSQRECKLGWDSGAQGMRGTPWPGPSSGAGREVRRKPASGSYSAPRGPVPASRGPARPLLAGVTCRWV